MTVTITPRKQEYGPIVELLEAGEYETSVDLAKAIVKLVAELLGERDMFGVAVSLPNERDGFHIAHGPYWTERQATKAVTEARGRGLMAWTAPLFPANHIVKPEEEVGHCKCGHPKEIHHNKWGCCVQRRGQGQCPCGVYEKG